jgi:hypothetical protein
MTDPYPRRPPPAPRTGARAGARRDAGLVLALVAAAALAGCSGATEFDREAAIGRVVDGGGGAIDRPQAECYVDEVVADLGTPVLAEGAQLEPDQIRRLTGIKIDCFGTASIGTTTSTPGPPVSALDGQVNQPMTHGSDPALDALWDQCAAGSGLACDQLFDQAPVRSEYEDFAGTCGFRTQELVCADVYTTSTTAAPSTPTP